MLIARERRHELSPKIGLHADDAAGLRGACTVRDDGRVVGLAQRYHWRLPRLLAGQIRLVVIEIERPLRVEDDLVALLDRFECHTLANIIVPGHHHFRRWKRGAGEQCVIPTDRRAPVLDEVLGYAADEPALELIHVREPELPHPGTQCR